MMKNEGYSKNVEHDESDENMVLEGCTMKITNRTPHPKSGATHLSSARLRWAKAQFPSTSRKKISWGRDEKSREHIDSGICPTT